MKVIKVRITNYILPDCWYRHLIGHVIEVVEKADDYVVVDRKITNDDNGEYNNTGLICKKDAIVIT